MGMATSERNGMYLYVFPLILLKLVHTAISAQDACMLKVLTWFYQLNIPLLINYGLRLVLFNYVQNFLFGLIALPLPGVTKKRPLPGVTKKHTKVYFRAHSDTIGNLVVPQLSPLLMSIYHPWAWAPTISTVEMIKTQSLFRAWRK